MKLIFRMFVLFFLFTLFFTSCNKNKQNKFKEISIFCDGEKIKKDKFLTSNRKILACNADQQNSNQFFSGAHSLLATKEKPYGFTVSLTDLTPDTYYHISVWEKSEDSSGCIVADGINDVFYIAQNIPSLDSNGWRKVELDFFLPKVLKFNQLIIYVWNKGNDSVYFDDFKIEIRKEKIYPDFKATALEISFDHLSREKLANIRTKAFESGILESSDTGFVNAKIVYGKDTLFGKVRLKGDYVEHITGDKISLRVKLKSKYSWKGMRTFSLHSPKARDFIDEKVIHGFCRLNDVLATRYDFVPVKINGKNVGIYAYEEHFEKNLVESLNRREGVIVKFSEDVFWANYRFRANNNINSDLPYYNSSKIIPFQQNKITKSKTLYNHFLIAQNLLWQFKNGSKKASEIFDLDKTARFFAIIDISGGFHSIHWHNMRFYYNPVISKLEPIAFDCNAKMYRDYALFTGYYVFSQDTILESGRGLYNLFSNKDFLNKYLYYLNKLSVDFDNYINDNKEDIVKIEKDLRSEFPYYHFTEFNKIRTVQIMQNLNGYKKFIQEHIIENEIKIVNESDNNYKYYSGIPDYLVQAYTEKYISKEKIQTIKIYNYFNQPVIVKGFVLKNDSAININENLKIIQGDNLSYGLKGFKKGKIKKIVFVTEKEPGEIHIVDVLPWCHPFDTAPAQELKEVKFQNVCNTININGNKIIFGNERHVINNSYIIPKGYFIIFNAGATVDIINGAEFISYSPVFMQGRFNLPVIVKSSDGTAHGFTVLQSGRENKLEHVIFDQLNTLNNKGWNLTGAVNFYESDVTMQNVTFSNNRCEDALNIIRSNFKLTNCMFDNIFADAFDSDYSDGEVDGLKVNDTGNDAIDFSTSRAIIKNCDIKNAGDKGVSSGEKSFLTLDNITVTNANIGIASKDLSQVDASNITLKNCNYGMVTFMKKPEYGPSNMNVNNIELYNIFTTQLLVEKASKIVVNNKTCYGNEVNVSKMFY